MIQRLSLLAAMLLAAACGRLGYARQNLQDAGTDATASDAASNDAASNDAASDDASDSALDGALDAGDLLSALDDLFVDIPLRGSWTADPTGFFDAETVLGNLRLVTSAMGVWVDVGERGLVSQRISGDFAATTRVRVRDRNNESAPVPINSLKLAGMMARAPDATPPDYVFVAVGTNDRETITEAKNTVAGVSEFSQLPFGSSDADLRICRFGTTVRAYRRSYQSTDAWEEVGSYVRSDLPTELQVGLFLQENLAPLVAVARFDEIVFFTPGSDVDCARN